MADRAKDLLNAANMPDYATRIINYLKERHTGKERAIPAPVIGGIAGIQNDEDGVLTREVIRELIIEKGADIGSCSNGFYWIATLAEYDENIADLDSRVEAIAVRANAMRRNRMRLSERLLEKHVLFAGMDGNDG